MNIVTRSLVCIPLKIREGDTYLLRLIFTMQKGMIAKYSQLQPATSRNMCSM